MTSYHHFCLFFPQGSKQDSLLCLITSRCTMSTHFCRVVELMRSACCQTIRGRSCLRKAAPVASNAMCFHGVPNIHRRTYSLDSLSSGHGPLTFGSVCQQHSAERMSPSSALAHRNLSAVALQVGYFFWHCWTLYICIFTSFSVGVASNLSFRLVYKWVWASILLELKVFPLKFNHFIVNVIKHFYSNFVGNYLCIIERTIMITLGHCVKHAVFFPSLFKLNYS